MKNSGKGKKRSIVLIVIASAVLILLAACAVYINDYYHTGESALALLGQNTENECYKVGQSGDLYVFRPADPTVGLVFYPGGKVEYTAYAPLMAEFARQGVLCVLIKMPFNLAVFDVNAADSVCEAYPEVEKWYIGGHSLGGAMAASYLADHTDEYEGLLLLGAYSTVNYSGTDLNVVSVYGSEDGVLNREKYDSCRENLPEGFPELEIEGGCHSYFGDYGLQEGDGVPAVTRQEQMELTAEYFITHVLPAK